MLRLCMLLVRWRIMIWTDMCEVTLRSKHSDRGDVGCYWKANTVRRLSHIKSRTFLNFAHSGTRPSNSMSSLTHSLQVFLTPLPPSFSTGWHPINLTFTLKMPEPSSFATPRHIIAFLNAQKTTNLHWAFYPSAIIRTIQVLHISSPYVNTL